MNIHTIDLNFQGVKNTIAAFLLEYNGRLILFETGPHSCFETLKKEIKSLGYSFKDIKHVFVTHIHFDHAGAAWAFAEHGAKIHVHPIGEAHLINPEKLVSSAKRLYKEMMDVLWGEMKGIQTNQVIPIAHNQSITIDGLHIKALHTPGHAKHHIAWCFGEHIICGDVAGVKVLNGPVLPPCPPPDINIEDWHESIDLLEKENAKFLYLTHFGKVEGSKLHLEELKSNLSIWLEKIKIYYESGKEEKEVMNDFQRYNDEQVFAYANDEALISKYALANPAWTSVFGLYRYLKKKEKA